ncbi:MAG: rod shape-determining protein RodA [Phycisphaerales bacterium]|nr:rod shape-determining protein RodA [Phycisphaerales bacterium]
MSGFARGATRAVTAAPTLPVISQVLGISWWNIGWIPVLSSGLLTLIGIAAISTTEPDFALRQLAYGVVGIVAAALLVVPLPAVLEKWGPWAFIATLGLLVLLVAPGVPEAIVRPRNGSRCWIDLGPIDMQPAEFAKLAWILAGAWWLRRAADLRTRTGLLLPIVLTSVPVLLILMQPDLGTALLFFPTLLAMLLAQGARRMHLGIVVLSAALLAPISYPVLKPHQRARIDSLVAQLTGDDRYNTTIGFQGNRARTLVGAGGIFGNGAEAAKNLVRFNALPEEHNDMIFAVVACRWGLVGGLAVILLEAALAVGAMWIAVTSRTPFGRLAAVGIGAMLGFQSFVNVGMTMGILPITGLTLPFVSFGGSSIVASWMAVGLLFSIAARDARLGSITGGTARRGMT